MPLSVPGSSIPDAPSNGNDYVRRNGAWVRRLITSPMQSGFYQQSERGFLYQTGTNIAANTLRYCWEVIQQDVTITELWVRAVTSVASNIQIAIYAADMTPGSGTYGAPIGTPLVQTASIPVTTTAGLYGATVTPTLIPAGFYWSCVVSDTTGNLFQTKNAGQGGVAGWIGSTTLSDISGAVGLADYTYLQNSVTVGALPNASGATRIATTAGMQATAACFFKPQ